MDYQNLIVRFLGGEITDNEFDQLKAWLNGSAENRQIFDIMNKLWQESSTNTKFINFNTDRAWTSISSSLGMEMNNHNYVRVISKNRLNTILAAAAFACIMAIGAVSLYLYGQSKYRQIASSTTIALTRDGEKSKIFLPDSTEIILNSESRLEYKGDYDMNSRKVNFSGEAFFNVTTNPEKPFVVQLDRMNVVAKGTRFNIYSFANENRIETTLEKGAVQILVRGKQPVDLKAGQQAVYFVNTDRLVIHDVSTDIYTSWKENMLRFDDTPCEEVLRRIGRKYNVTFELSDRDLLDLKYTATFIDESITSVMDMLKSVSPINYKIYYRTTIGDKKYLKPRIVISKRKPH